MSLEKLSGERRERRDPTQELLELALNEELSDEELAPMVRQAIDDGADVNVETIVVDEDDDSSVEDNGCVCTYPVLHLFFRSGRLECIDELLLKNVDLEKTNSLGYTALQLAVDASSVLSSPESKVVKIVRQLLLAGADIDAGAGAGMMYAAQSRFSPIIFATYSQQPKLVQELLRWKKKPNLEECRVANIGTALALAVSLGNEEIIRHLIKAGAKLEARK